MGLKKGLTEKRMYNIKPSLSPLSSLYYLFSPFHPLVSAPRYAFTALDLPFSCVSMILDDCLMIISPPPKLSADLSQSLPTYKFFSRTPSLYTFFSRFLEISLVHLIVPRFSSRP